MPLRLVSTFLHVGRVEIACGLLPTLFLQYLYKTIIIIIVKKGKISGLFIGKIVYVIKNCIKNYK